MSPIVTDAELAEHRADAESLMVDFGRALRLGAPVYDEETQESTSPEVELFEGRCKIRSRDMQSGTRQVGDRTAVLSQVVLHVPVDTPPLDPEDIWEMRSVGPLSISAVGRRYKVVGPFEKTWARDRRYEVEEVIT